MPFQAEVAQTFFFGRGGCLRQNGQKVVNCSKAALGELPKQEEGRVPEKARLSWRITDLTILRLGFYFKSQTKLLLAFNWSEEICVF